MFRFLVTGVNGFVGKHLVSELVLRGFEVVGAGKDILPHPTIAEALVAYHSCDLSNEESVASLPLNDIDAIINLAGLAAVGKSFEEPDLYMEVNVSVFSALAACIRKLGRKNLRIVAVSTGAVYAAHQPLPLTEDSNVDSTSSPYAASKLAMEEAVRKFRTEGYDAVIARPFNHIGPGQGKGFLLPDLFSKLTVSSEEIKVGNLETKRDYTDVRDVARAYTSLATAKQLKYDTYNVCSGRAIAGNEILEMLKVAMHRPGLTTNVDHSLFRPSDQPVLYGDNSRIQNETGWSPTIPLEQTIVDFVKSKSA